MSEEEIKTEAQPVDVPEVKEVKKRAPRARKTSDATAEPKTKRTTTRKTTAKSATKRATARKSATTKKDAEVPAAEEALEVAETAPAFENAPSVEPVAAPEVETAAAEDAAEPSEKVKVVIKKTPAVKRYRVKDKESREKEAMALLDEGETIVPVTPAEDRTEEVASENTTEIKAENPEGAEEAPAAEAKSEEDSAEKSEKEEAAPAENHRKKPERYQTKKGRNGKKGREEYPAEVNLEANPDAPKLYISVLTTPHIEELRAEAAAMGISEDIILDSRKTELIHRMCRIHSQNGGAILVEGTLEIMADGNYGYLRYAVNNYLPGGEDVYVSAPIIKATGLKTGDFVYGQIRAPREGEKAAAMIRVFTVNGEEPKKAKLRAPFDSLTPLFPDERLHLEVVEDGKKGDLSTRVVDLFCPIGKGQRSLIVAPPRTGKTVLMQKIANAITTNHPDVTLIVLLVDERPEEVTDMKRNVKAEVIASTFDEQATHHVQVAEMVIEKAKRLVEYKKDVVILLDSITRLARAYNQTVPASGKILSGGVDSNALHRPKRFFGAARNVEEGGSLTIISTALIETGSRMDEVIFEEFKGTGTTEIVLDRKMADNRKFPAINIKKSGTRRDDLLLPEDVLARVFLMRTAFGNLDDMDMSISLLDKMRKNNNNKEFLDSMNSAAVSNASPRGF